AAGADRGRSRGGRGRSPAAGAGGTRTAPRLRRADDGPGGGGFAAAAAALDVAAGGLRRTGAAAGGSRNLRPDVVHRGTTDARDRTAHGVGRGPERHPGAGGRP